MGRKLRDTVAPAESFQGQKGKLQQKVWAGEEIKHPPTSQASPLASWCPGVLAFSILSRSVHPGQKTGSGDKSDSQGCTALIEYHCHKSEVLLKLTTRKKRQGMNQKFVP